MSERPKMRLEELLPSRFASAEVLDQDELSTPRHRLRLSDHLDQTVQPPSDPAQIRAVEGSDKGWSGDHKPSLPHGSLKQAGHDTVFFPALDAEWIRQLTPRGPSPGRSSQWLPGLRTRTPSPEYTYSYMTGRATPPPNIVGCVPAPSPESRGSATPSGPPPPRAPQHPFVMTAGSEGHPHQCGQPCKYFRKRRGCKDGADCTYCHICEWNRYARGAKQIGSSA